MAKPKQSPPVQKHAGGRPRAEIDKRKVTALARIHCTDEEIASVLGLGVNTIRRHCRELIDVERMSGKASLRRLQWQGAQAGNPTMLIWLGKQLLGQKDIMRSEQTTIPIEWLEKLTDDELTLFESGKLSVAQVAVIAAARREHAGPADKH